MKICTKCKEEKPLERFGPRSAKDRAPKPWCKDCCSEWARKNYSKEYEVRRNKEWRKNNREKFLQLSNDTEQRRRARKLSTQVEPVERQVVWERDNGVCYLCKEPADNSNWHLEHLVPLSKGGPHTYDNVAVAHPKCNLLKGARTPEELNSSVIY